MEIAAELSSWITSINASSAAQRAEAFLFETRNASCGSSIHDLALMEQPRTSAVRIDGCRFRFREKERMGNRYD